MGIKDIMVKYRVAIICSILFVGVMGYVIADTYSKYITSTSGSANVRIARWKIMVNNQDVVTNNDVSSVIEPVFSGSNDVAPDVIAPGVEGYFDITIDGSDTDVSFNYTIYTDDNENSDVSDLILSGYSIDGGSRQSITSQNGQISITNSILYNQVDKDVTVRIYFKWNDDENNGALMDNSDDTDAAKTQNASARITVGVRFVQIAGSGASSGTTTTTTTTTTESTTTESTTTTETTP